MSVKYIKHIITDIKRVIYKYVIIIWNFNSPGTSIDIIRQKINKEIAVLNENKNTTFQNLWNAAEAILKGKFMQNRPVSRHKKNFNKKETLTYYH